MLIIGECINASNRTVAEAIARRDSEFIEVMTKAQAEAGADFIDVNVGAGQRTQGQEVEAIEWLVKTVQAVTDKPLTIDSDVPGIIEAALRSYRGETVMINSITAEPERLEAIGPLAAKRKALLVALAMGSEGIPVDGPRQHFLEPFRPAGRAFHDDLAGPHHSAGAGSHHPADRTDLHAWAFAQAALRCGAALLPGTRSSLRCVFRRSNTCDAFLVVDLVVSTPRDTIRSDARRRRRSSDSRPKSSPRPEGSSLRTGRSRGNDHCGRRRRLRWQWRRRCSIRRRYHSRCSHRSPPPKGLRWAI